MRALGHGSIASIVSVVLAFVRFGTAIGLFVAVLGMAILPFVRTPNVRVSVPVSFRLDNPSIAGRDGFGFAIKNGEDPAKPSVTQVESVAGALRIPSADKRFIAVNGFALIAVLMFTLFVIDQVRAVLRTLVHGNPFDASNAKHIQRIGLAVIVGELARAAIVFAENYYAMTHVTVAGLMFDAWPRISFTTIGYGLIILIIVEVFRTGTRLDEEQSLTI
jgi:hypothetical protein